ncbi:MAG: hypothetical protein JNN27_23525 [Planctomycetes bacterium]|nr:hypothetical protein [Planctomycetota bacterium]
MKNLILGLALVAGAVACKSQTNSAVSSGEAAPATGCATKCDSAAKSECSMEAKKDCEGAKVCPATGAKMN